MIRVQECDFDTGAEIKKLTSSRTDIGAVVCFTGLVRDMANNEPISEMMLEHYPGMTEKELEDIEQQARERWSLSDSLIIHRFGRLRPGDNIVLVIACSAHRQAAFDAAAFMMDFLKSRATFWKKETGNSSSSWVDARESDTHSMKRWNY